MTREKMDNKTVKASLCKLIKHIPFKFPPTGWYFTPLKPPHAVTFDEKRRICMFEYFERVTKGEILCFSARNPGCSGAACYLGFKEPGEKAGTFLSQKEGFKKNAALGNAFYAEIQARPAREDYLIFGQLENIEEKADIEVVNLWADALSLTGLVTMANYDRPANNNVLIPFASGCQSVWTIPYKEKPSELPKCVVGLTDPSVRGFFPADVLSFSLPVNRLIEICDNISGSFLKQASWKTLVSGIK
ncbi:DUF169 domain-containing protein [Desulfococcaceae bacterium HSG8]|nr:DUF169 domain-containing protein [Desulfococcaceae bacterium HSG8]